MPVLLAGALLAVSCQEKAPEGDKVAKANITGTVIDDQDNPLEGVTVTFVTPDAAKEQQAVATTNSNGTFLAEDVPSTARLVNFTKEGYASASTTIAEAKFETGEITLETAVLVYSQASIEGNVFTLSNEPYADVTVTCGTLTTTTTAEGGYKFEGLTIKGYTLNFSDADGNTAELEITAEDFTDGIAYAPNVTLGSYVMPGLTYSEIQAAPYWYGNNYAGGVGAFQMQWNHVGFLTMFPYKAVGYRNAAEGISLVSGPDNEGELVSYIYGRKTIFTGNCYINLCARTFRAYEAAPAKLGVGVMDLSSGSKEVHYLDPQNTYQGQKKMGGGTTTLDVEHNMFAFDLSEYAGKEIAFAIGVFGGYQRLNEEEGYPETPIVRILFADKDMTEEFDAKNLSATFTGEKPEGYENWPGFTKANLSSLMPNPGTSFSGESFEATDGEYANWAGTNHFMTSWVPEIANERTVPLQDGSLFALASFNGNLEIPTGYMMSRFTSPKKNMTIACRTYDSTKESYLRVTVVDLNDFSAAALAPTSESTAANEIVAGENGTIGLNNDMGSVDEPSKFAKLKFDLSAYAGKDVVIVVSAHKGNVISFYSIDFAD